jgi:hypothetical protein
VEASTEFGDSLVHPKLACSKANFIVLLQKQVFLLSRPGRGFDENVKVDIPGQMAEHIRHFLFTCIFNDLQ